MTTFGIEIEFLPPAHYTTPTALAEALSGPAGLAIRAAYRQSATERNWKIVNDSSVCVNTPGGLVTGFEAVSPVLQENQFNQIDAMCRALSAIGARVNRTCGLHVHIGANSLSLDTMKRLAILYAEVEPWLDSLLPPSRRESQNIYCTSVKNQLVLQKVLDATNVAGIANGIANGSRYVKLSFSSYWRHGTIEFRHHSGTIDAEKIKHWAWLCSQLVATAMREVSVPLAAPAVFPNDFPPGYWDTGRRTRTIWTMLNRPEGVTAEELRQTLGLRAPPSINIHVVRAGAQDLYMRTQERRDGHLIWRRAPALPVAAPIVPPATTNSLEEFLERVQVPPEQRTYWIERAALLNEPAT